MRGGIKRTRTGCSTCKERRIKCDETAPICRRCTKKGLVCRGNKNIAPSTSPDSTLNGSRKMSQVCETVLEDLTDIRDEYDPWDVTALSGVDQIECNVSFFNPPLYDTSLHNGEIDHLAWTGIELPFQNNAPKFSETNLLDRSLIPGPKIDDSLSLPKVTRTYHSPIPQVLQDQPSVLVEYYFKHVARLFSCYDGKMNPFRSNVSQLWGSTASIYYTVQSMAAACLLDVVPSLSQKGIDLRKSASSAMELELSVPQPHAGALLALIMLGLTASWHNSHDLGRSELERAHKAFSVMKEERRLRGSIGEDRNIEFFHKAILYWEMLLSYVVDDQSLMLDTHRADQIDSVVQDISQPRLPHPWTGVACKAQQLVFEVGRLIRQSRQPLRRCSTVEAEKETRRQGLSNAIDLKNKLHELVFPATESIVDPGDEETPVDHFLKIAECYRDVGLLQLCREFPELLHTEPAPEPHTSREMTEVNSSDLQPWLTKNIIELLESIPNDSGTRCVQPFLLVAVASELRFSIPSASSVAGSPSKIVESGDISNTGAAAIDIFEARKFVISRLSLFEHTLPAKPIRQMLEVMKETWSRMDEGDLAVNWLDVMIENGWETIMG